MKKTLSSGRVPERTPGQTRRGRRIATFDIAKGVGILAVVAGHMDVGVMHWAIFSFHMPLFFLISGYFFRPASPVAVARKRARQLLLPYAATGVAIALAGTGFEALFGSARQSPHVFLSWLARAAFGSGTFSSHFFGIEQIGAIWFLLALFCAQVTYATLAGRLWAWPVVIALFALGVITAQPVWLQWSIWLPWSIQSAMTSIIFVHIGYRIRVRGWFDPHRVPTLPFLVAAGVWAAAILIDRGQNYYASNYFACPPLDVAGGVAGTLVVMWLSVWVARIPGVAGVLAAAGRYSLVILCAHIIELDTFPWWRLLAHLGNPQGVARALVLLALKIAWAAAAVWVVRQVPALRKVFSL